MHSEPYPGETMEQYGLRCRQATMWVHEVSEFVNHPREVIQQAAEVEETNGR